MILVDAGTLAALVRADDPNHMACVQAVRQNVEPVGTVWPAFTAAMYLLGDLLEAQEALWEMLDNQTLEMLPLSESDRMRMRDLMRYAEYPLELADAALVTAAQRDSVRKLFTVDEENFRIYRLHDEAIPA